MRNCTVLGTGSDGVTAGLRAVIDGNSIMGAGNDMNKYGIRATGDGVIVRNNNLTNDSLANGPKDVGVAAHGAVIIDNVIHCETSIVNLGGFSYTAPLTGDHANMAKYAAGFC